MWFKGIGQTSRNIKCRMESDEAEDTFILNFNPPMSC